MRREIELLLMTMYAALPLYATQGVAKGAVAVMHLVLLTVLVMRRFRSGAILPAGILRVTAIAYLLFFPIDAILFSSLIAASTNLVFFIVIYQALDESRVADHGKRLLTIFLIFTSSIATATHISILFFIAGFAVFGYRQLIYMTHDASENDVGQLTGAPRVTRPAFAALAVTSLLAVAIFPMLPRVHNPFVRGFTGALEGTSTGLSETIDFRTARTITPNSSVVARIWMPRDAVPFFTPVRLRGRVYDTYNLGQWSGSREFVRKLQNDNGRLMLARPAGFSRAMTVQQTIGGNSRLYVPSDTWGIRGLTAVYQYGQSLRVPTGTRGVQTFDVDVSRNILPLEYVRPPDLKYPITPQLRSLAQSIVAGATTPREMSAKIETWLSTNFSYVPDPASLGRPVSVDEFLLRERRGHCEYFAAGMVVLLQALDVPARIVGGFYGGKINPLTGYFVLQRSDAHAWVEVYDGEKWLTFDPTPPALRPGNSSQGIVRAYASALSESVNYLWDRYVLTYGFADQVAIIAAALERVMGGVAGVRRSGRILTDPQFWLRIALLAAAVVAGAMAVQTVRRRRRPLYLRMLSRLRRRGIEVSSGMTASEIVAAVERDHPHLLPPVRAIVDDYLVERFSAHPPTEEMRLRAEEGFRLLSSS